MSTTAYEGWAIVDLFGHTKLAGNVSEVQQYGTPMIRIEVPEVDGVAGFTTFKGGGAIYSLTPTTEEIAKGVIRRLRPQPVNAFDVDMRPRLGPVQEAVTVTPAAPADGPGGGEHEAGCGCPECEPDDEYDPNDHDDPDDDHFGEIR